MRKFFKNKDEVLKNLKRISFPLSSTWQWYHVSNSTTIYLAEWKITIAILVVNNLFSHIRDPLQGQRLLSNFRIRLIKTVLLNFFFSERKSRFHWRIFFWQKAPSFLDICTCSSWNLEIQNMNIWSFRTLSPLRFLFFALFGVVILAKMFLPFYWNFYIFHRKAFQWDLY